MSDDKLPTSGAGDAGGDPGGAEDELLRRAARAIRASTTLQAMVPLSSAERERLADAAIDHVIGQATRQATDRPAGPAPRIPLPAPRRLRPRFVGIAATAVALAAVVALVVRSAGPTVPPVATYAMVLEGEQHARGAAPSDPRAPVTLRPETRLTITLTADRPERDALVRLVLVRAGAATLLEPPIVRGRSGQLAIEAPAAELLGAQADGPAELVVVLGRALPSDDEIRALALGAAAPAHLQVMRRAVILDGFSHAGPPHPTRDSIESPRRLSNPAPRGA